MRHININLYILICSTLVTFLFFSMYFLSSNDFDRLNNNQYAALDSNINYVIGSNEKEYNKAIQEILNISYGKIYNLVDQFTILIHFIKYNQISICYEQIYLIYLTNYINSIENKNLIFWIGDLIQYFFIK